MPVRAAGFWYAIAGVWVAAFGWMTGQVERNGGTLPAARGAGCDGWPWAGFLMAVATSGEVSALRGTLVHACGPPAT